MKDIPIKNMLEDFCSCDCTECSLYVDHIKASATNYKVSNKYLMPSTEKPTDYLLVSCRNIEHCKGLANQIRKELEGGQDNE